MNTQTFISTKQMQIDQLKDFATELKENGFTVLVSAKHPFEWLHFEKGGKFGTVSPDHYFNFNFGSVHKPCRECGTGFGTDREVGLSIKHAENSLGTPAWASMTDRKVAQGYKSVNEFIQSTHNKWAEYYTL